MNPNTMNDQRPTPETDAFWNSGGSSGGFNDDCAPDAGDMLRFAKGLERERDEAREQLLSLAKERDDAVWHMHERECEHQTSLEERNTQEEASENMLRLTEAELLAANATILRLRESLEKEVSHCPGCHGDRQSRAHSFPRPCPRCEASREALSDTPAPPVVWKEDAEAFLTAFERWKEINNAETNFDAQECIRRSSIMLQAYATYRAKHPTKEQP
jgi:hypothetical protein